MYELYFILQGKQRVIGRWCEELGRDFSVWEDSDKHYIYRDEKTEWNDAQEPVPQRYLSGLVTFALFMHGNEYDCNEGNWVKQ